MALKLITAPASEPVTLAEAKLHLRVETGVTDDDAWITATIQAARERAEHITNRAFITQTWELALDAFPAAEIKLPKPPLASITSVSYTDSAGVDQTLSNTLYTPDLYSTPGWLLPAYGTSWPATRASANAVRVRYVAGYGAAAAVPQGIKNWMLLVIGQLYAERGTIGQPGVIGELPYVDRLLDAYRVWDLVP